MSGKIEIVAHRGANERAPENTMPALKLCVDLGIDYIELDVRRSMDGVLYNFHDTILNRTTNGFGPIAWHNSDKLDSLDAGTKFSSDFRGERIPRIEDVLDFCAGKIKVYFDVKNADTRKLIEIVHTYSLEKDCFFWFKNDKKALEFKRTAPELALKINASSAELIKKASKKFNANIIECGIDSLNDRMINTCRSTGMKLMVRHGREDREVFRRIIRSGADMANIDQPDIFLEVLEEEQVRESKG